ncbi:glycoside hydrolase family protein [Acholeplasma laidlawii]|uniref:hypothetical protein n=1 Tax=Acholeplasma laidlawii TaxID=2148 RepID=UPI0021F777E6|nr:hypothetical protein [Acholeplasma laidlawii]
MRKVLVILHLCIIVLGLMACDEKPIERESELMNYEQMYQNNRESSYDKIPSHLRHVAEHGYYKKLIQGHNEWYYLAENETLLTLNKNKWQFNQSYIENEWMHSESDLVMRKFVAKHEGEANLTGFIKPKDNLQLDAYISIKLNDSIILEPTLIKKSNVDGISYDIKQYLSMDDVLYFIVESDNATLSWNPVVSFIENADETLHFTLPNGKYLGDVHPFYDDINQRMYMYYLDTNGHFDSRLVVSDNMIKYRSEAIYTDPTNPPEQNNYFVLGVIKQEDTYRTYFGLGDGFGSAESKDLITWKNSSILNQELKMERKAYFDYDLFPGGGRDPFVFYDQDIDRYRIIGMAYKSHPDNRSIVLYTSDDAEGRYFTQPPVELINYPNAYDGDPECTMVVKINNRWYIFTSRYGKSVHGVGRLSYFMGGENVKIDDVDWKNIEERHLDGEDLAAAQLVNVSGRFYVYGWLPQVWNQNHWGGVLNIAREVVQRPDGVLGTQIDPYLTNLLKRGVDYQMTYSYQGSGFDIINGQYKSTDGTSEIIFNDTIQRSFVETKIDMPLTEGQVGIILEQSNRRYKAKVTRSKGELILSFGQEGSNHDPSASLKLDPTLKEMNLKLIIEGGNAVLSINDFYTLSIRSSIQLDEMMKVGIFSTIKHAEFRDFKVHRLATLNNIFE